MRSVSITNAKVFQLPIKQKNISLTLNPFKKKSIYLKAKKWY